MLSSETVVKLLAGFSYKPGWRFSILDPAFIGGHSIRDPTLLIEATVINSYPPHQTTQVVSTYPIWPMHDAQAFVRFMRDKIMRVEEHESMEWLRFNGELVNDPHRGDNRYR